MCGTRKVREVVVEEATPVGGGAGGGERCVCSGGVGGGFAVGGNPCWARRRRLKHCGISFFSILGANVNKHACAQKKEKTK